MDAYKFSGIAHSIHEFWSPVTRAKLDVIASLMDLPPGARIIDFGCGNGEMLATFCRRFEATGLGIDRSPYAGKRLAESPNLAFHLGDASDIGADGSFDLAICSGATGIFGGLAGSLAELPKYVRPGGLMLIGEGSWEKAPDADYLEATGIGVEEMVSHAENVAAIRAAGLTLLYSCTSNQDEWDEYEGRYASAIERYVAANPGDPDCEAMVTRIRAWNDAYVRWGRGTMGFGFYLARW